jgi:Serine aminopeptidase, S33
MAKNIEKIKTISTNVRYIKAKQKSTRFFLSTLWHVAPDVTKGMVLKRFFKPISHPPTPIETQYLENATSFHIRVHGTDIRCWKWGRGPGILFVHGWNGRGVNLACFFKPMIDAGYSVITYDAPAHGESKGHVTNYFELSDTVRSFLAPSREYNIQGIIAHSIGASAVINCISKDNPDIDVVLIAPALKLRELTFNLFIQHGVPEIVYQSMIGEMEGYYGYNLHRDNPYVLAKTISSKMLIIHDKDDRTIPYSDSKLLSEKTDYVFLHTTKGLGHKRILKDNAVVNVAAAFILNGQFQHDRESMKNVSL